jgi:hypothetical protein
LANCVLLTGGTWNPNYWSKIQRSLGPYRIATALEQQGYSTFVLDYIINLTTDEILKVLSQHVGEDTLWVGFSSTFFWPNRSNEGNLNSRTTKNSLDQMYYTENYQDIETVIDYIRLKSNARIIYGGAKAPYFLVDDNIDHYITGNADVSIIEITRDIETNKVIPKVIDSTQYLEPDINNISTHWWNKNFNIIPGEGLPIELARGCIFKCKFCNYPLLGKKKGTYLRNSVEVKNELIKIWETHGTTTYYLTDDTFNDDNDKLEALHRVFTELPFKPKFSSYLRIDLLNKYPHQVELLEEMGLVGTFFGLETLQAESAKSIGKGLHPNKVKDRLYWLADRWKNKVNIEAGFILGLPHDTRSYFNELLNWCLEDTNPIQAIHFYPLMLFHYDQSYGLERYSSEFSINPEIYGYEFKTENNAVWELPSQQLNYQQCLDTANIFNELRTPKNKISGFHMITSLNIGISLEDIYALTHNQIIDKYNVDLLNLTKINQYKSMLGLR